MNDSSAHSKKKVLTNTGQQTHRFRGIGCQSGTELKLLTSTHNIDSFCKLTIIVTNNRQNNYKENKCFCQKQNTLPVLFMFSSMKHHLS